MQIEAGIIEELKKPQGILIPDAQVKKENLNKYLVNAKRIVSVGDRTTKRLLSFGIVPDISVIDGYERRRKSNYNELRVELELKNLGKNPVLAICKNPKGTISDESISIIKKSLRLAGPVIIKIEGEEDLLALPFFHLSELSSIVVYGQPLEGMVLVRVTRAIRAKAKRIIRMLNPEF
jgi:GTP-dependent dephospho-CoA kinase